MKKTKINKNNQKPNKNRTSTIFLEIFAWIGAVLVVTAYALTSFSIIEPTSLTYQLMNLIGSAGVLAISIKKHTYQPVLTNGSWLIVALIGLINILTTNT